MFRRKVILIFFIFYIYIRLYNLFRYFSSYVLKIVMERDNSSIKMPYLLSLDFPSLKQVNFFENKNFSF